MIELIRLYPLFAAPLYLADLACPPVLPADLVGCWSARSYAERKTETYRVIITQSAQGLIVAEWFDPQTWQVRYSSVVTVQDGRFVEVYAFPASAEGRPCAWRVSSRTPMVLSDGNSWTMTKR